MVGDVLPEVGFGDPGNACLAKGDPKSVDLRASPPMPNPGLPPLARPCESLLAKPNLELRLEAAAIASSPEGGGEDVPERRPSLSAASPARSKEGEPKFFSWLPLSAKGSNEPA